MTLPDSMESSSEYSKPEYHARSFEGNTSALSGSKPDTIEENEFSPLRSSAEQSELLKELKDKCIEFTKLKKGWDGFKASPVPIEKANVAMHLIDRLVNINVPKPSIVPTYDGSIQIEWHMKNYELEIEITQLLEVEGLLIDRKTDEMHEFCVNLSDEANSYQVLADYILKLQE